MKMTDASQFTPMLSIAFNIVAQTLGEIIYSKIESINSIGD